MASSKLKPTSLKKLLIVILIIVIAGSAAGFYFAKIQIAELSKDANTAINTTDTNQKTQAMVTRLNSYISTNQAVATNSINKVVASSSNFEQQVTTAIDAAAANAGININKSVYGKPADQIELPAIEGLSTNYVTLTISSSINYNNFIKFLQSIENSTPKMQIMSVNITPKTSTQITVTPIVIGFYVR